MQISFSDILPYALDALVIILPLISIIVGYVKGFTHIVLPFALTVLMLIVARCYAAPMAQFFTEHYFHNAAVESLTGYLSEKAAQGSASISQALPQYFQSIAESSGYTPDTLINAVSITDISEKIVTAAEPVFIIPMVTACIYMIFYALSKILSVILLKPAELLTKLPLVKQANKALGVIAGIILGTLRLGFFAAAVTVIISFLPESAFASAVSGTKLLSALTDAIIRFF